MDDNRMNSTLKCKYFVFGHYVLFITSCGTGYILVDDDRINSN